ncbi:MAG TPA: CapA family protein [Nitrososphaerales archaeon]|nr:CapA family protein [Nitrososphaerales archaeon]
MKIAMVGDVMLGRLVNETLQHTKKEYPWGDTLKVLNKADVRLCNLECAISDRGEPWSFTTKEFHFRTDSKNVSVLRAGGINLVSLANNHALDFGYAALSDTLEILDEAGIAHAGAGRNLQEAESTATMNVHGSSIGVLAFTDNEPEWEATKERPGVFYVPTDLKDSRAIHLLEHIKRASKKVDLLIVSAHWGPNWGYDPPMEHIPFAHALIDAGAGIVFGHSSHVVRGIETYHDAVIIYSAGNFIDDYAVDAVERNDRSCIFMAETSDGRILRLGLYPTIIDTFQARLAGPKESEAIAKTMKKLCEEFNTMIQWRTSEPVPSLVWSRKQGPRESAKSRSPVEKSAARRLQLSKRRERNGSSHLRRRSG